MGISALARTSSITLAVEINGCLDLERAPGPEIRVLRPLLGGPGKAYISGMDRVVYDRRTAMFEQLHQVALMLDRLCWEALTDGPGDATVTLIDASQAVHRALVVLGAYEPQESLSG
jgi:hypothetical protein